MARRDARAATFVGAALIVVTFLPPFTRTVANALSLRHRRNDTPRGAGAGLGEATSPAGRAAAIFSSLSSAPPARVPHSAWGPVVSSAGGVCFAADFRLERYPVRGLTARSLALYGSPDEGDVSKSDGDTDDEAEGDRPRGDYRRLPNLSDLIERPKAIWRRVVVASPGEWGNRGEGYVAAQFGILLCIALGTVPLVGGLIDAVLGPALIFLGLGVLYASAIQLGDALTPFPAPLKGAPSGGDGGPRLIRSGVYSLVRHPMYAGTLCGMAGLSVLTDSAMRLILTVVLASVLDAKSDYEERGLEEAYPEYAEYRRQVEGKFVPRSWLRLLPWIKGLHTEDGKTMDKVEHALVDTKNITQTVSNRIEGAPSLKTLEKDQSEPTAPKENQPDEKEETTTPLTISTPEKRGELIRKAAVMTESVSIGGMADGGSSETSEEGQGDLTTEYKDTVNVPKAFFANVAPRPMH